MPPNAGKQANELSVDEELLCSSVRSVTLLPHNVLDTILERKNGRTSRVPYNSELGWTRIFFAAYPVNQMATLRFVQVAYILMAFVVVLGDVLGLVSFYMHPLGCSSSAETGMTPFSRLRFTSLESRDGRTGDSISTPGISKFELLFHAEGAGRPLSVPHIVNRSWTEGASMYIALDGPKIPSCPAAWYFVTASSNGTQADDPVKFALEGSSDGQDWYFVGSSDPLSARARYSEFRFGMPELLSKNPRPLRGGTPIDRSALVEMSLFTDWPEFMTTSVLWTGFVITVILSIASVELGREGYVTFLSSFFFLSSGTLVVGASISMLVTGVVEEAYLFFLAGVTAWLLSIAYFKIQAWFDIWFTTAGIVFSSLFTVQHFSINRLSFGWNLIMFPGHILTPSAVTGLGMLFFISHSLMLRRGVELVKEDKEMYLKDWYEVLSDAANWRELDRLKRAIKMYSEGRKFSKPRQLHRRVLSAPNEQSVRQRGLLDHLRVLSRSSMWGQKASVFTVSSSVRLDTGKQVPEQSLSFLTNVNDPGISDVGQITRNNPYWALAPFLLQARPPENEPDASEDLNLFKDQNSIQAQKSTTNQSPSTGIRAEKAWIPRSADPLCPVKGLSQMYRQATVVSPALHGIAYDYGLAYNGMFELRGRVPGQGQAQIRRNSNLHQSPTNDSFNEEVEQSAVDAGKGEKYGKASEYPFAAFKWAKVKSIGRCLDKIEIAYEADTSLLLDVARTTIVFSQVSDLVDCLEALCRDPNIDIVRIVNGMDPEKSEEPLQAGLKFVKVNMAINTERMRLFGVETHVCELILILHSQIILRRTASWKRYIFLRNARNQRSNFITRHFILEKKRSARVRPLEDVAISNGSDPHLQKDQSDSWRVPSKAPVERAPLQPLPVDQVASPSVPSSDKDANDSSRQVVELQSCAASGPTALQAVADNARLTVDCMEGPQDRENKLQKMGMSTLRIAGQHLAAELQAESEQWVNTCAIPPAQQVTQLVASSPGIYTYPQETRTPATGNAVKNSLSNPSLLALLLHHTRLSCLGWGGVLSYTYRVCLDQGMHSTTFVSILAMARPLTIGSMISTMQAIFFVLFCGYFLEFVVCAHAMSVGIRNQFPIRGHRYRFTAISDRLGRDATSPGIKEFGILNEKGLPSEFSHVKSNTDFASIEEVRAGTSIYLSGFRDGMDALADETGRRRSKGWDVGEASVRRSSLNGQEEEDEEEETLRGFYLVMSDDRDADHDPTSFLICVSSDRLGDHELTATELDSLSWTPVTTGSWIPSISESLGVVNMPISKPTPLPLERGGIFILDTEFVDWIWPCQTIFVTGIKATGVALYILFGQMHKPKFARRALMASQAAAIITELVVASFRTRNFNESFQTMVVVPMLVFDVIMFIGSLYEAYIFYFWLVAGVCNISTFYAVGYSTGIYRMNAQEGILLVYMPSRVLSYFILAASIIIHFMRIRAQKVSRNMIHADQMRYEKIWQDIMDSEDGRSCVEHLGQVVKMIGLDHQLDLRQCNRRMISFKEQQRQRRNSQTDIQHPIFNGMQTMSVPGLCDLHSPVTCVDQLFSQARIVQSLLKQNVQAWADSSRGMFQLLARPEAEFEEAFAEAPATDQSNVRRPRPRRNSTSVPKFIHWSEAKNTVLEKQIKWPALKTHERSLEKLLRVYADDASRLVDIARYQIVFENMSDLTLCLGQIAIDSTVRIERIKNRMQPSYKSKSTAGYRDVNLNIKCIHPTAVALGVDGHICEIQLVLKQIAELRSREGHALYVQFRNKRGI